MQPTIQDAIRAINPTLAFHISPDGVPSLTNLGGTLPSDEEINAKLTELIAEWNSTQYQRDRKADYPSIGDQLDDLYHAGVFSDGMAAKIKSVKDNFPKE